MGAPLEASRAGGSPLQAVSSQEATEALPTGAECKSDYWRGTVCASPNYCAGYKFRPWRFGSDTMGHCKSKEPAGVACQVRGKSTITRQSSSCASDFCDGDPGSYKGICTIKGKEKDGKGEVGDSYKLDGQCASDYCVGYQQARVCLKAICFGGGSSQAGFAGASSPEKLGVCTSKGAEGDNCKLHQECVSNYCTVIGGFWFLGKQAVCASPGTNCDKSVECEFVGYNCRPRGCPCGASYPSTSGESSNCDLYSICKLTSESGADYKCYGRGREVKMA